MTDNNANSENPHFRLCLNAAMDEYKVSISDIKIIDTKVNVYLILFTLMFGFFFNKVLSSDFLITIFSSRPMNFLNLISIVIYQLSALGCIYLSISTLKLSKSARIGSIKKVLEEKADEDVASLQNGLLATYTEAIEKMGDCKKEKDIKLQKLERLMLYNLIAFFVSLFLYQVTLINSFI